MKDIQNLRTEVKHLTSAAQQLEPFVKTLSTTNNQQQQQQQQPVNELTLQSQQLQAILDHINKLQLQGSTVPKGKKVATVNIADSLENGSNISS